MTNLVTNAPAVAAKPAAADKERRISPLNGVAHIALFLWALATAGPLIWVVLASFKDNTEIFLGKPFSLPAHFSFKTYADAWSEAHIGQYFLNSVFVVVVSTAGTMLLGAMAAYVLARYRFPGNRALYYLFVSGLAFPTFMAIGPLFGILQSLSLLNTYTGLILVYIAYSLSFTVFFLTAFFQTLPAEIDEAAMMDGAGHLRRFFQVMMPMAKSGLVSITIFNIVGQWNQYLLPVVIMQGAGADSKWVLTQGVANISTSAGYHAEWSTLFAALTLSILPMIVVYGIFQRQIQAGLTAGAVK
ncbi:sugar ABC transporter permease [Actinoplanes sp. SE50]|uniref:carbohydrate ABC transporter permease n=1 Tax=unclassified Actinoplanes TaxID=2626549 RepID=UPI00023ED59C|nr:MULTISPECIES: carbohydrate ABC transporter permease [unclassified Actinoplanes]AEV82842.1 sn-glycerol-3-phosphate transport system permease protein ugpE [Actinoplanes sp. SE50/110]ATO81238.1 sugar ABC transporter permease [Actinoplanes sp. SE50]SLL98645.1 sugar ABC transporter permease [Actinoplanes sp. SE50/110]